MFDIGNMENLYLVEGKIETSTPSQGCICISKHQKLDLDSPPSAAERNKQRGKKLHIDHRAAEQWHGAD